jgi:ubiquinone/menaquinone biosynthesis C-methylase UbiE
VTIFIKPSIGCKKKNLKKYLTYRRAPKNEISFGLSKKQYLRYYYRCDECGHLIAKHKKYFFYNLYDKKYFKSTYKSKENLNKIFEKIKKLPSTKSDNYHRLKRIKKIANIVLGKDKIDLLDVGSGTGIFPIRMISKKYNITALEPNKESVDFIKMKSNSKVETIHGDYLKISANKLKKYHLITFNKVLEHVEKPILFLKKTSKLLKKNNLIYIEVPDAFAINDKKEGKNREEFGLGHHHVFTKKSLENILKLSNFKIFSICQIREPSGKYTIYAFGSKK